MCVRNLILGIIFSICLCSHIHGQEKGWIPSGNLKVYYEKSGTGAPIVFLHAGFMDHRMWERQTAFLKKKFTVITLDQPRHGLTSGSDTTLLIADLIRICLDSLHIQKTSLAGLSLGGVSVADFAIAYPERTDKLIFVSSGLNGFDQVIPIDSVTKRVFANSGAATTDSAMAKNFTENWGDGPFRGPTEINQTVRSYVYGQVLQTQQQHAKESWIQFKENPKAVFELTKIKALTLIITADKDVPYIGAVGHYLQQHITGSKLVEFKGAAHMVNMEQTEKFNELVDAFLSGKF